MERRSKCPITFALDIFGDRWTLLVVRDLAFEGKCSFSELLGSDEGIATNILADRLAALEESGIIEKRRDTEDKRRFRYSLSDAGKDLIPVLVELIVWSSTHDSKTIVPRSFVRAAKKDRAALIKRLRDNV